MQTHKMRTQFVRSLAHRRTHSIRTQTLAQVHIHALTHTSHTNSHTHALHYFSSPMTSVDSKVRLFLSQFSGVMCVFIFGTCTPLSFPAFADEKLKKQRFLTRDIVRKRKQEACFRAQKLKMNKP